MPEQSPKVLKSQREDLDAFRAAYIEFLEKDDGGGQHSERRSKVIALMPAAERALAVTGAGLAVADPPMAGTNRVYEGLANVAFLHEQPGFRMTGAYGEPGIYDAVIDALEFGSAKLSQREQELREKRRKPTYWLDRIMRGLLTFPAYLVGLLVGQSTARINASQFGLLLRILAAFADALAVFGGGKLFGFW